MKINRDNIKEFLRGASVLAYGGGLSYREQVSRVKALQGGLRNGVDLFDVSEFEEKEMLVTVAEIGPAGAPPADWTKITKLLDTYVQETGIRVSGLIPGEMGQESIILHAAAYLDLPIVDSDLAGCRAVPRLTDLALKRVGVAFQMSPLSYLRGGRISFIGKQKSLAEDEKLLRQLVGELENEVIVFMGGSIQAEMLQKYLDYKSFSLAQSVGKKLLKTNDYSQLLDNTLLFGPMIAQVEKIESGDKLGFSEFKVVLESGDGRMIRIKVVNEFLELCCEDCCVAFPDMICLIDPEKKIGVHSSDIQIGDEVVVVCWERFKFWK